MDLPNDESSVLQQSCVYFKRIWETWYVRQPLPFCVLLFTSFFMPQMIFTLCRKKYRWTEQICLQSGCNDKVYHNSNILKGAYPCWFRYRPICIAYKAQNIEKSFCIILKWKLNNKLSYWQFQLFLEVVLLTLTDQNLLLTLIYLLTCK